MTTHFNKPTVFSHLDYSKVIIQEDELVDGLHFSLEECKAQAEKAYRTLLLFPEGCVPNDDMYIVGKRLFFDLRASEFVLIEDAPSKEFHDLLTAISQRSLGRITYCKLGDLRRALQMSGFYHRVCKRVVTCNEVLTVLENNNNKTFVEDLNLNDLF